MIRLNNVDSSNWIFQLKINIINYNYTINIQEEQN